MRKISFLLLIALLSSCSTMTVYSNLDNTRYSSKNANFKLEVKSGYQVLDSYVSNLAQLEFSKHVPINENRSQTGLLEVIFKSNKQTTANVTAYETDTGYSSLTDVDISTLDFQNSIMLVVMKDLNGKQIWAADFNYKGRTEFISGALVNTAEEAARVCIKRISQKMGEKFHR